ncbi:MAG TPA: DsbA family protein [Thermoleophilaceae bacterium]|nr:DsbA family protein [Thermoleophilaceae bacterium]
MTPSPPDAPGEGLGSSPPPPLRDDDHLRGDGTLVIEYADLECPYCARANLLLAELPVRRAFRHFPIVSKHPRARVLAHALEAAGIQGRFWEMHGALLADQGHLDDPHLWQRCERLGIDVARFDSDRRSGAVAERVQRDFRSGVRAGVMTTPTLFVDDVAHPGVPDRDLLARLGG